MNEEDSDMNDQMHEEIKEEDEKDKQELPYQNAFNIKLNQPRVSTTTNPFSPYRQRQFTFTQTYNSYTPQQQSHIHNGMMSSGGGGGGGCPSMFQQPDFDVRF